MNNVLNNKRVNNNPTHVVWCPVKIVKLITFHNCWKHSYI